MTTLVSKVFNRSNYAVAGKLLEEIVFETQAAETWGRRARISKQFHDYGPRRAVLSTPKHHTSSTFVEAFCDRIPKQVVSRSENGHGRGRGFSHDELRMEEEAEVPETMALRV